MPLENVFSSICKQWCLWSACTDVQADQSLLCLVEQSSDPALSVWDTSKIRVCDQSWRHTSWCESHCTVWLGPFSSVAAQVSIDMLYNRCFEYFPFIIKLVVAEIIRTFLCNSSYMQNHFLDSFCWKWAGYFILLEWNKQKHATLNTLCDFLVSCATSRIETLVLLYLHQSRWHKLLFTFLVWPYYIALLWQARYRLL